MEEKKSPSVVKSRYMEYNKQGAKSKRKGQNRFHSSDSDAESEKSVQKFSDVEIVQMALRDLNYGEL